MSTDIALNELVAEELYERASACYVELLDKSSRIPKITDVMDTLSIQHPDIYPSEHRQHYLAKLHNKEFGTYLEKFRGEYQQRTLASKALAAHLGHNIGSKALAQLMDKLDDPDADIKVKDLIALAQLGFGLAEKVGEQAKAMAGDDKAKQNVFQTLVMSLPPEHAEAMTMEIIRRAQKQAMVIDA